MNQNELAHHGIKGMRWGVRRSEAQLARARGSSAPSAPKKKIVGEGDKTNYKPRVSAEELSDKELKARIQRIENERKYNQLTAKEKSAGRKFVEDIIVNAGKQALTSFVNKKMSNLLDSFLGDSTSNSNSKANTKSEQKTNNSQQTKTKTNNTSQQTKSQTSNNSQKTSTSTGLVPMHNNNYGPAIDMDKFFR